MLSNNYGTDQERFSCRVSSGSKLFTKLSLEDVSIHGIRILVSTQENLPSGFTKNKDADQPAHLRSLISVFVIRLLESIISRIAPSEISIF